MSLYVRPFARALLLPFFAADFLAIATPLVRVPDERPGAWPGGAKIRDLVDRFHETNRIGRMELKPTDLILRRREAPSRRMAAGSVSLAAVLRDARKSALLRTRLTAMPRRPLSPS